MKMAKMAGTGCISVRSVTGVSLASPLEVLFLKARQTSKSRSVHACSSSYMCGLSPVTKPQLVFDSHQNYLNGKGGQHYYCLKTLEELQETTRVALRKSDNPTAIMKLIDDIQRLGVGHHFEEEINMQLERVSDWKCRETEDLFVNARRFRLLRHNGWQPRTDTFNKFLNKDGNWKQSISKDTWGMLSLYEASYLATKDEQMLLQAMEFTRTHLTQSMPFMAPEYRRRISQALELPRHLRMARLEARKYIDEYSREWNHNLALLELAKLDFNMVQSLHQRELAEIQRWWKELDLVGKLGFGRDRPLECFLWTVGIFPEPHYSNCRIELTKTIAILLVVDDIFDTYGSLSDLVLFTNAIQRWDLDAMEHIPEYMKICYMALYNTTNEISFRILKEHGWNVVPHLKRTEYLANGVTTGGTYMALVHAFFLIGQGVNKETAAMIEPYPKLFSCAGKILRLWDDLGTAREEEERGDVASSMACYMRENTISSEEEARKHVRQLIRSLWVDLNSHLTARAPAALPLWIINASLNLARTSQLVYQNGDDFTNTTYSVKEHTRMLFSNPISLEFLISPKLAAL
ncbi:hypothetical protein EZV62_020559 [Acer yangbiense]|uniref:(+)-delta-cadinene synthase n=1 Tax=Acer yangbiense TaxID=1000413 RepID=A0A5C7HDS4_9ROSI|nr:hypothetical protein EZV62_020559 [Acer yangbiense]